MSKYLLMLFITGENDRSNEIISVLTKACKEKLKGDVSLEIVNVLENPEVAVNNEVLATPTLLKKEPPPARRFFGDFSDANQVVMKVCEGK